MSSAKCLRGAESGCPRNVAGSATSTWGAPSISGFPYYGRWLLAVGRVLVEKHHIGLGELTERMAEVKERYAGGLEGKTWRRSRSSKATGRRSGATPTSSTRSARAIHRCTRARPARPSSRSATRWWSVSCRCCSTPAHPNTCAAPRGDRRGRLRKPRRRGRDLGPSRRQAGVVLRRAVQPVRTVGRLHRDRRPTRCGPRFPSAGSKPPTEPLESEACREGCT